MRLSSVFTIGGTFVAAAVLSLVTAYFSAKLIEAASKSAVLSELDLAGLSWAEVDTHGLQVFLIGTAPDEATRLRAVTTAGKAVDAARVIDQMLVEETMEFVAPRFSMQILRNDAGISAIGLVPAETDRENLVATFEAVVGEGEVSDLLQTADYPAPPGWDRSMVFALSALRDLPRSQISVNANKVEIKAQTESEQVKRRLESDFSRKKPDELTLALDLSAPRPVITPFAARFVIDDTGPHFDSCSVDDEQGLQKIQEAATKAGVQGTIECEIGLGVPSRRWSEAVALAVTKLAELGGGTVTFSNADIALVALEGTSAAVFDRIVGELEAALPPVFALNAVLPVAPAANDQGPSEFVATLSPEGGVQLRGRLESDLARQTVASFARARFGSDAVYMAARLDENLSRGWQVRALAALEALTKLNNGAVTVTAENFVVTGATGNKEARSEIAKLLTSQLGEAAKYDIKITYEEKLDLSLGLPTPDECEARIVEIIGSRKISFEPGSSKPDSSTEDIFDELAELLKTCGDIPLEIGGHTDSQGREEMNQELSYSRALAVRDALRNRLVPTRSYSVVGFGETQPIADNDTEEGREANRRIEFKLLRPEPVPDTETTLDSLASETDAQAEDPAADSAAASGEQTGAEGPSDE